MEGRLLFKNCSIFRTDGRIRSGMAVAIDGPRIAEVAPDEQLPARPGDWEVTCRGRLLAPGLMDCHTHLVGAQLMPTSGDLLLKGFIPRVEAQLTLGAKLTVSEVEALSAFGMAKALRSGVTLSVEHLYAPRQVRAALEIQAATAERLGARLINSHASLGGDEAFAHVDANGEYVEGQRSSRLARGAIGVFGSFCCEDRLLAHAGKVRERLKVGAHFHLSESEDDLALTYARYGQRIVTRFDQAGLLAPGSVGAYARGIDRAEVAQLLRAQTLIAINPKQLQAMESGFPGSFEAVLGQSNLVGLSTGGLGSLWEELFNAFSSCMAVARTGRLFDPDGVMAQLLVGSPAELLATVFGHPCGSVEPGFLADLVLFDHVAVEEADGGMAPHLLLQLGQSPVAWTVVEGRVVVREGQLLGADYLELAHEAAKVVGAVWARA